MYKCTKIRTLNIHMFTLRLRVIAVNLLQLLSNSSCQQKCQKVSFQTSQQNIVQFMKAIFFLATQCLVFFCDRIYSRMVHLNNYTVLRIYEIFSVLPHFWHGEEVREKTILPLYPKSTPILRSAINGPPNFQFYDGVTEIWPPQAKEQTSYQG